jgi:hypothetical protein
LTFEDLVTSQNGMSASRALVNIVIDQQIGQQISVGIYYTTQIQPNIFDRSTQSVKCCNRGAAPSAAQTM